MKLLIDRLEANRDLPDGELLALITMNDPEAEQYLARRAEAVRRRHYGDRVFIRGLIEFTNYCKNDCHYCGIRRSNRNCRRYRLTREEILSCCETGYALGFRTFVLQGGEDPWFTRQRMTDLIKAIKTAHPDCALTLSVGEKDRDTYQEWFDAGADRYLLRHETANPELYASLHPSELSLSNRMRCLQDLKDIGYQVGCGFMVGSPGQTNAELAKDLKFIEQFKPEMCGIGPFIPHQDTPFAHHSAGTLEMTCCLLSIIRLIHPTVLLPATTALGTIHPEGRELGIRSGANVVMPNLSPAAVRKKYMLYDNKLSDGDESAQCVDSLRKRMAAIGYEVVTDRGDYKNFSEAEE